jgi:putative tricarboxylic transport membrane protein
LSKGRKDCLTGIGSITLGLLMLFLIIPRWVVTSDSLNLTSPDTFPNFAAWMLVVLGALLLIKTRLERRAVGEEAGKKEIPAEKEKAWDGPGFYTAVTFLDIALFGFLLDKAGYWLSSIVCGILLLILYRSKKWYYYAVVVGFTFLLYYVFGVLLRVKMP